MISKLKFLALGSKCYKLTPLKLYKAGDEIPAVSNLYLSNGLLTQITEFELDPYQVQGLKWQLHIKSGGSDYYSAPLADFADNNLETIGDVKSRTNLKFTTNNGTYGKVESCFENNRFIVKGFTNIDYVWRSAIKDNVSLLLYGGVFKRFIYRLFSPSRKQVCL